MPTSKLQVHKLASESEKHALSKGFRGVPECLKSGINLPVAYLLPIFFQFFRLTLKKTIKETFTILQLIYPSRVGTQKSLRRLTWTWKKWNKSCFCENSELFGEFPWKLYQMTFAPFTFINKLCSTFRHLFPEGYCCAVGLYFHSCCQTFHLVRQLWLWYLNWSGDFLRNSFLVEGVQCRIPSLHQYCLVENN